MGVFKLPSESLTEVICRNPAQHADEVGRFSYSYRSIDDAVKSSKNALSLWKKSSLSERMLFVKKWSGILKRNASSVALAISRETGRPVWECDLEIQLALRMVQVACSNAEQWVSANEGSGLRPIGTLAVITPFSMPLALAVGHVIPALLMGNTVVMKPSEKTPFSASLLAEYFQQAQLIPGVFNLIQGEREVGRRLCAHEGVDGVLFFGLK